MNDTIETIKRNNGTMPFPSHVTRPCSNHDVVALAAELINNAVDTNNILATGNIHYFVRNHYVNPETGVYGIERLIEQILRDNQAVMPKGIESTELRNVAIGQAMFTDDIISAIRLAFGKERYPDSTIRMYLTAKGRAAGKFCAIALTSTEDKNRKCKRPRNKWYLPE